jgi:hypothetical protein
VDSQTTVTSTIPLTDSLLYTKFIDNKAMQTAIVTPKSSKAKNRLANMMNGSAACIVEQQKDDKVFLASMNRKYFFWVDLNFDPNWIVSI